MLLVTWLLSNRKRLVNTILSLAFGFLLVWGITLSKQNKKLSEGLEMAQNNIEAYLGIIDDSLLANNVLRLSVDELQQQNDKLLKQVDSVRSQLNIKTKNMHTAATQTQSLLVSTSKGTEKDLTEILRDTIYNDSIYYNDYTKIFYSIAKDSVNIKLDIKNTQYLFVYSTREYKNKKNFFKRLFTLDFKKVTKTKYEITNTNPLLETSDVRVIEIKEK